MYICPNCNKTSDTPMNFCSNCGSAMVQQDPIAEAMPVEEPVVSPVVTPIPVTPVATAPVYTVTQTPAPSKGKMITGMILGIAGVIMGSIGLLYTLLFIGLDGIMAFSFGLVFSMISAPLSLVGMILSRGCAAQGHSNGMISAGKITGMIGTICSGVMLFLAFIGLMASM